MRPGLPRAHRPGRASPSRTSTPSAPSGTTENSKPVDASGSLKLASGDINFKNAIELVTGLAKAPEVQACMVRQWLRYGLKRHELESEEPSIKALEAGFKAASYDMRELLVALTKTRAFTHRALSEGEVTR